MSHAHNLDRFILVILIGVIATAITAPRSFAVEESPVGGVYALSKGDAPIPQVVFDNPNVDGVALRFFWNTIEPGDGVFNWAPIDEGIQNARAHGKKVALSITAGIRSPAWLYADGASAFTFTWTKSWGPPPCSQQRIPIPWNPVFLSKWQAFVQALGARYNSNPAVTIVKLTGLNTASEETNLPRDQTRQTEQARIRTCSESDSDAEWEQVGYSPNKVLGAWRTILSAWAQALTNKKLALMITPAGFPSMGGGFGSMAGGFGRRQSASSRLVNQIIQESANTLGDRFIVQNNGLSAKWNWTPKMQVNFGYQMLWSVSGDSRCRMNHFEAPCDPHQVLQAALSRGVDAGATYIEVYIPDLLNPQMQDVLAQAHASLANR